MTAEALLAGKRDVMPSLSDDAEACVQRLQDTITKEMPTVLPPQNSEARYPLQMKKEALEAARNLLQTLEVVNPDLLIAIPRSVGNMQFDVDSISLNELLDARKIAQQYIWSLEAYTEVVAISLSVPNPKRLSFDEEPSDFLTPALRESNGQFEICIMPNLVELRRVSVIDIDRRATEISLYIQEKLYPGTLREKRAIPLYRCKFCGTTYEQDGKTIVCPQCKGVSYDELK